MTGFPVWFDANINQGELRQILEAAGYCLTLRNGIMRFVKKVPASVRREEPNYAPS